MGADRFCSPDDLFICSAEVAVADVVHDCAGENETVLHHDTHLFAERTDGNACDIDAID